MAVYNHNNAPVIFSRRFIDYVPCIHHFKRTFNLHVRDCEYGDRCLFSHDEEIADRYRSVCLLYLMNKPCDPRHCQREHRFYAITGDLIADIRGFIAKHNNVVPDGNYVTVLKSPLREIGSYGRVEPWLKFNFRQEGGVTHVEHRDNSRTIARFQLKTWQHPTDLFDYIPKDVLDRVYALGPDEEAEWADPRVIDGAPGDGVDRSMWRVRVDKSVTYNNEAAVEFMCTFKASDPTVPCAEYDDSEPCLCFYVKFHVKEGEWEAANAGKKTWRTGKLTLAEWLDINVLGQHFGVLVNGWERHMRADLAACVDSWEAYTAHFDWKLRFGGYDEASDKELTPLADVAALCGH